MTPERYGETYWSLLSPRRPLEVSWHPRYPELREAFKGNEQFERVVWFSHGYYAMKPQNGQVTIADLRMGEGESFTFTFALGSPQQPESHPKRLPATRPSLSAAFRLLVDRL